MQQESQWTGINTLTDKFDLEVNFSDNILKIRLRDFLDWSIYEKSYSNTDTGSGQIHKKVDLVDIFNILAKSERNPQKNQVPKTILPDSKIKKDEKQFYKVDSQGKITVYLKIQSNSSVTPLECISHLALNKKRKMNNSQIWACKSILAMNQKYQRQIESLKLEKAALADKITKIQTTQHSSLKKQEQMHKSIVEAQKNKHQQQVNLKNGRYRIRHHNQGYISCNNKLDIYLTKQTNGWEEWVIEKQGDHYLLKSYHDTFLRGTPEYRTRACNTANTWQHWYIEPEGQYYFIKSCRGNYLAGNKDFHVYLSDHRDNGSRWKLIP